MLRGVWKALNCLSIDATFCVIVAGASSGETKMWAAVRENGDFLQLVVAFVREPERKSPLGKIPHDVIMTSSYE